MNSSLIKNWNMRVKPEDIVFFLGDFCFRTDKLTAEQLGGVGKEKADFWIKQLNGHIIFVKGNHDQNSSLKTIIDSVHITFANQRIHLCHKPEHSNPDFHINLVGHVHQNWKIRSFKQHYDILEGLIRDNKELEKDRPDISYFLCHNAYQRNSNSILLNVGVDVQRYAPVTLDEAIGQCIKFRKGIQ